MEKRLFSVRFLLSIVILMVIVLPQFSYSVNRESKVSTSLDSKILYFSLQSEAGPSLLFKDGFEGSFSWHGVKSWGPPGYKYGPVQSSEWAHEGSYSLLLETPAISGNIWGEGQIEISSKSGKIAYEFVVKIPEDLKEGTAYIRFDRYLGGSANNKLAFEVGYRVPEDSLRVMIGTALWKFFSPSLHLDRKVPHVFRMVVDTESRRYVSFSLDDINYDLSAYSGVLQSDPSIITEVMRLTCGSSSKDGAARKTFFDNVTVTLFNKSVT